MLKRTGLQKIALKIILDYWNNQNENPTRNDIIEYNNQIDENDISYHNAVVLRCNGVRSYKKENGYYRI